MIKAIALPLALIFIMFGMGMTLKPTDFKRVLQKPLATFIGLINQLVLLPLVAFALCSFLHLQGEIAVGLILIASCPGGATSNMISHLCKGDTALSVSLTAISSLVTTLTIPLYLGLAIHHYLDASTSITLPFLSTVLKLMIVSVLPIIAGMIMHAKCPQKSRSFEKPVNIFSLLFLILIVIIAILQEEALLAQFKIAGPAALSLNVITMLMGFGLAALVGLGRRQRITLSIESGIQNGTLALAIALEMLKDPLIAMPAVAYSLLMFATGGIMIVVFGRHGHKRA
ncbi:bile acid:sodium symporter family protein [Kiritimatiellota bacterium B12222]|nr:bile acid:sodium symporter family protein [Kiritimatiellota bacterium B12222]